MNLGVWHTLPHMSPACYIREYAHLPMNVAFRQTHTPTDHLNKYVGQRHDTYTQIYQKLVSSMHPNLTFVIHVFLKLTMAHQFPRIIFAINRCLHQTLIYKVRPLAASFSTCQHWCLHYPTLEFAQSGNIYSFYCMSIP